MAYDQTFGSLLRHYRKQRDFTQKELAVQVGCAITTIRKLEAGLRRPSHQMLDRLAVLLELTSEEHKTFELLGRMRHWPTAPLTSSVEALFPSTLVSLPHPPTSLIGRNVELATLEGMLRSGGFRLITLVGAPGVGKTRLALEVASRVYDIFADGIAFVSLVPVSDAAQVVATIAQTLGVRELGGQPLLKRLCDFLRGRRLLLVLDNFEHVMPAAGALASLLAATQKLTMLVTSREALMLRAEQRMPIGPLSSDAAVALFAARAQAATPDFAFTSDNTDTVAALCDRLDRLPLAIELAAARVGLLTPAVLHQRVVEGPPEAVLDLLGNGLPDLPLHQKTARAAIDWSYQQLDPLEQRLFAQLAVFAGSGALETVTTICADATRTVSVVPASFPSPEHTTLNTLESLARKSLVQRVIVNGKPRVQMLETLPHWRHSRLSRRFSARQNANRCQHTVVCKARRCTRSRSGADVSRNDCTLRRESA